MRSRGLDPGPNGASLRSPGRIPLRKVGRGHAGDRCRGRRRAATQGRRPKQGVRDRPKAALRSCLAPLTGGPPPPTLPGRGSTMPCWPVARCKDAGERAPSGSGTRRTDEPGQVMHTYLAAVEALSRSGLDAYLSIKAPALGFSPELVAKLLERTRSAGVRVHFDSLSPESAERTLALIAAATQRDDELGITLPARWRRSLGDADAAVELGLGVRVVKGQWPDPDAPEQDPRAGFLAIVERAGGARPPGRRGHPRRGARPRGAAAAAGGRHPLRARVAVRAAGNAGRPRRRRALGAGAGLRALWPRHASLPNPGRSARHPNPGLARAGPAARPAQGLEGAP